MNENIHQGERLKTYIDQNKINKTDFANRMKISRRGLYNLFKKDEFDKETLKRASEKLRLPLTYFTAINFMIQQNQLEHLTDFEKMLYDEVIKLRKEVTALKRRTSR